MDIFRWLPQKLMAELFEATVPAINEHLKDIFAGGKLLEDSVIRKFRITEELQVLGHIVNAHLDLAEERAMRKIPMIMEDWSQLGTDKRELAAGFQCVSSQNRQRIH